MLHPERFTDGEYVVRILPGSTLSRVRTDPQRWVRAMRWNTRGVLAIEWRGKKPAQFPQQWLVEMKPSSLKETNAMLKNVWLLIKEADTYERGWCSGVDFAIVPRDTVAYNEELKERDLVVKRQSVVDGQRVMGRECCPVFLSQHTDNIVSSMNRDTCIAVEDLSAKYGGEANVYGLREVPRGKVPEHMDLLAAFVYRPELHDDAGKHKW